MLRLAPVLALFAAAPVLAEPDRVPLLCGDRDAREQEPFGVDARQLIGTYRCSDEGLTITLTLDAEGRFEQRMVDSNPPVEGEAPLTGTLRGRWRLEDGKLILFETPVRAPVLTLKERRRDPAVWLAVTIATPDGKPADGLLLSDDPDGTRVAGFDEGKVIVPRSYSWEPGRKYIMRAGDELVLGSVAVTRTGENSFRYVYAPSEVEPFRIEAGVADAGVSGVAIPLGIGGALLKRLPAR